jgi:cyclin T
MPANRKHFDISQLPSLKDGMTIKEESDKRRKTCRFIEEAGRVLKLPRVAVATAMVFFHRFYAKHSFSVHDRFEVAVACLVLAAKTEESPKKLNTVIDECYKLKVRGMQAGRISSQAGGPAALSPTTTTGNLDPKSEEFLKLKERILLLERVILHTIGFELSIDHPYKFMVEQIKKMVQRRQLEYTNPVDGPTAQIMGRMLNEMVQYAMNFANDSMHTSLCLQFEPHKIATACVYLAGHCVNVRPVNSQTWLDVLGPCDVESLASISLQVVELITDRKLGVSQATFDAIRQDLDALNKKGGSVESEAPVKLEAPTDDGPDVKRQRTA